MEVENTNVPGSETIVDEKKVQIEEAMKGSSESQPSTKNEQEPKSDELDIGNWMKEFEDEIKREETQKRHEDIKEKKDIAKQLYSKFRDELSKEQQANADLKAKLEEMEKRISNLSAGSKTTEHEPNPFREPVRPDTSKDKTEIAKKAAQMLGVRMHN